MSESSETSKTSKRGSYRAGFAFGSVGFVVVALFGALSTVVTARLYGVRVIGQYALVMAPASALWVLSNIKEQAALIKEITGLPPRHPRVTQLFAAVFTFSVALTTIVAGLTMVICWFVFRGPLHAPELVAPTYATIVGYVLITNTGWNIDSIFSAFVAGRQIFWVRLHEVLSFITLAVLASFAWPSIWGLVIATTGAPLTTLVHRVLLARGFVRMRLSRKEYGLGLRVLPDLLKFGLRATPGQIAQSASQQGGVWALGIVAPVTVVGAYSRALTIPQRLQQASLRITEVLYPTLVGRHEQGDGHGFDRALIDSIRYEMVGMLLIAAVIGGAARSVLEVFGAGFSRASSVLVLLSLFPALASVTVTQTQALWATNRPGWSSIVAFARLLVTVVLLVVLTPPLGIIGPAIALLGGYAVFIVAGGLALRGSLTRPLRATWPRMEQLSLLIAYVAGFAAARAVEQALDSFGGLLLSLFAGTSAYAATFLLSGGVNRRDRERVEHVLASARAWTAGRRRRFEPPAEAVELADAERLPEGATAKEAAHA
jgi:O-antigen/teichoic acid export membrane protein